MLSKSELLHTEIMPPETNSDTFAYIFDFDGVLADSMEIIYKCFNDVFRVYGFTMEVEYYLQLAGRTPGEIIEAICTENNCRDRAGEITEKYYSRYEERLYEMPPVSNNVSLINLLKTSGHPVAIASSSPKREVKNLADRLGIQADVIVSSEEVRSGKPSPDVFLLAARLLEAEPENCVVVEDSENGVKAAQAAGMHVLKFIHNNS